MQNPNGPLADGGGGGVISEMKTLPFPQYATPEMEVAIIDPTKHPSRSRGVWFVRRFS